MVEQFPTEDSSPDKELSAAQVGDSTDGSDTSTEGDPSDPTTEDQGGEDQPEQPDPDDDDETGNADTGSPPWPRGEWYSIYEYSASCQLEGNSKLGDDKQGMTKVESAILNGMLVRDKPALTYRWGSWACKFVATEDGQGTGMLSTHTRRVTGEEDKPNSLIEVIQDDGQSSVTLESDWAKLTIMPATGTYEPMFNGLGVHVPVHSVHTSTETHDQGPPTTTVTEEDYDGSLSECDYIPLKDTPLPDQVGDLASHDNYHNDQSSQGGWITDQGAEWHITPTKWQKYPDIEVVLRLFIPAPWVVLDYGSGYAAALEGDGRGFDYHADDAHGSRAYVRMTLNLDPTRQTPLVGDIKADYGFSHTLEAGSFLYHYASNPEGVPGPVVFPDGNIPNEIDVLAPVDGKPWWWWDWNSKYTGSKDDVVKETHLQKTDDNLSATVESHKPNTAQVRVKVCGSVPAADPVTEKAAPTINAEFLLELKADPSDPFAKFRWTGAHDGFPAYELYLNGEPGYLYSPENHNASPLNLITILGIGQVAVNEGRSWLPLGQSLTQG